MDDQTRTLTKDTRNGMVGGVCAGLADYFDLDALLVRAVFVSATVLSGFSVVLYLVLWIALDDAEPEPEPGELGPASESGPPIEVDTTIDLVAEQADPIEVDTTIDPASKQADPIEDVTT